ncbi:unnamed protein product, partial [Mesorhabditis spiculigera]
MKFFVLLLVALVAIASAVPFGRVVEKTTIIRPGFGGGFNRGPPPPPPRFGPGGFGGPQRGPTIIKTTVIKG